MSKARRREVRDGCVSADVRVYVSCLSISLLNDRSVDADIRLQINRWVCSRSHVLNELEGVLASLGRLSMW